MNREEKNKITFEKIEHSAMLMFGEKGYKNTTVDDICKHASLSKGIIFYYFKNKDTLFLHCIHKLVTDLVKYLDDHELHQGDLEERLHVGFRLRPMFLSENIEYKELYYATIYEKPDSLKESIRNVKQPLRDKNEVWFESILENFSFGKGVTKEDGIRFFNIIQLAIPMLHTIEGSNDIEQDLADLILIFARGMQEDKDKSLK